MASTKVPLINLFDLLRSAGPAIAVTCNRCTVSIRPKKIDFSL